MPYTSSVCEKGVVHPIFGAAPIRRCVPCPDGLLLIVALRLMRKKQISQSATLLLKAFRWTLSAGVMVVHQDSEEFAVIGDAGTQQTVRKGPRFSRFSTRGFTPQINDAHSNDFSVGISFISSHDIRNAGPDIPTSVLPR